MQLYDELADWWPLLSAPEEYAEEAAFYAGLLRSGCARPPRTLLELGSGGGNNASHLKAQFELTLVEPSAGMRRVSQALNPECEHQGGEMRTVRLGRTFDCVLIHDAVVYMASEDDLRRAIATAAVHCAPGGAILLCPDHVRENFAESTDSGGRDLGDRGLRYLEWTWDPDPGDTTYQVDYCYLFREGRAVRAVHDTHIEGLFPRATWLRLLSEAGCEARAVPLEHSELAPGVAELFLGARRTTSAREP